ncbi:probable LRR receptor-like serine/threonine-protein kinase At1g56130 [Carica papaya]|uniref:probable LRR receptor-like serine/threonine-protein kinase At1g56130 n=1 Tax=Carica papaya TaxID=3649 RepID=UPI000B8CE2DF|nr:probable LRR receptor-like serine/threonine-protein kinase At1g56130 [Carica papaya]
MLIRLPVRFPLVALYVICISTCLVRSQNQTAPTTDPDEARTLNSIFSKWGITAEPGWNISGEICSGVALSTDATKIDDPEISPLIKCDCSFNNNTLCRIRELKVSRLSVEGPIPEELWTLTRLTNLNLGQNVLTGPLSRSIGNLTRMQWLTFGINSLSGEIPKEVGLLTDLRSFAIGANNFSGSLPPDLGNCRRLEQL